MSRISCRRSSTHLVRRCLSHRPCAAQDDSTDRRSVSSNATCLQHMFLDERRRMVRSVSIIGLCCMLLWGSTACVPQHNELSALSERGHRVTLSVSDTLIWVDSPGLNFPRTAELVVRVRDTQGQPVDGIAVVFSVEPDWTQDATF